MNTNNFPRSRYLAAAVSAVLSLAAASTHAGPQNGTVTQGAATISTPAGNITQIDQTTSSVSIDWQSFDVAANEQVNFNQPTASSVALNRILTQDPSQILGSLNANGRVFLLNPNGIIFGASARVNVGSLVASSLDLTDADAAAGRYSFGTSAAQSGAIINHGALTAANGGSITLLGGSVLNTGLIVADYGTVNLGAGRAATLSFDGDGLMRFQIDAGLLTDSSGAQAAVDNTGQITADGGQVLLTAQQAGDVVARAVNNDGVIRAARVENVGGVIRLVGDGGTVVNSGTLEATASNGAGGEIAVLGENVSLTGTALVDVSGTHGGGTAYIGGGFAGADPALLNAQSTTVDAGAVIRADSMQSGDAGRVAVWSEGRTTFNGDILARAGGASGNGGFAEVSGRQNLRIGGHATLTSENGMAGSLLLDPGTINIVDGSDAASASDNEIGDEWIIAQLATPGTLTISTAVYGDGSPATLTVDSGAEITWGTASTLELIAGSSVSFEAGSIVRSTDGGSLTINSGAGVDFSGTLELDGNLSVTAGAAITQSAAIEVGGTTTISATNQAVTLDDPDNQLAGSIGIDAGTTVLANSLATQLSASSITGDFTLTSSGAITQTGALTTAANATFTAGNGESITLGEANAFGGTVTFGSTGTLADVTVRDTTAFDLQALNLSGDLNITADGISQSGAVSTGSLTLTSDGAVTLNANAETAGALTITAGTNINQTAGTITTNGATTLSAGQAIALTSAGNNFAGSVSITDAASAQLTDSNAIDLGASTVDGALTVNTLTGGFTQSGAISAGSLSLSAQDVTFSDNVTTGALTVTANGGIDQTAGTITATGNADFTAAGGSSISVAQATNRFDGTIDFNVAGGTLQNVFVADTTALQLQALNTAGNLTVNAESIAISGAVDVGGNASLTATANGISQTDVLTVDGTTTLSAAGQTITLTNTSNDFVGSVGITAANAQLADINAINLGTSNLTGTLEISAGGSLTQSGALNVGGDVTLDTGTGAITLDNVSNSFGSTIRVTAAGDTTLRNAAPTVLGTSMITGGLNVTSVGAITQTNALTVAGLTTIAASGQSVTLNGSNAFNGGIGVTAGSASITNSVATDLRASTTTGLLSVDSTGALTQSGNITAGSLTLASDSAVTLSADTTTTTGALTITAGTNINQTAGAIMAAGSTTLSTPGQTITLTSAGNDFTGSVSVTDAASAQLTDSNAIDLGASTVDGALTVNTLTGGFTQSGAISAGSLSLSAQDVTFSDNVTTGALTVTANGGIDQTAGTITVTGNADFTAANARSISVAQATNRFDGNVDFNAASGGTLLNVSVSDTTALQLQALNTAGNLTVNAESIAVSGAVNVGGNASLTATASGISQTDVLTVGGTTTLNAAGQTIQLTNTSNTFGNSIGITAATASLNNSVATTLGTSTIGNSLTVNSTGTVDQSGALNVTGNTSINASGQNVTLNAANTLTGNVSVAAANAELNNTTTTTLGVVAIGNDLTVNSTGAIGQAAAINVAGSSTFNAANQDVTLATAGNTLSGGITLTAANASLTNTGATILQSAALTGSLTVTSNSGAVTQVDALDVDGATTVVAAGQNVTLSNATNAFGGGVGVTGANVVINNAGSVDLRASTVGGNLTVTSSTGTISQSGSLNVTGSSTFSAAGGQSVLLDDTANAFGTGVLLQSSGTLNDVSLAAATTLNLQGLTIDGDLTVDATTVTQSGTLSVGGAATLTSDAGIALNALSANSLTVNVTAGAITQTGDLTIADTTTINAGGQDVTLLGTNNSFGGSIAITAATASLNNSVATTLGTSTIASDLTVNSTGAVDQSGVLNVTGSTNVNAFGQNVTLDAANTLTGSVAVIADNAELTNTTATTLGASTIGNDLTVNSTGAIGQIAAITVAGSSTFNAENQDVTLATTGNTLGGGITLTAANASLTNTVTTELQASRLTGNLTVNSTGAITQSGALNVAGVATLGAAGQDITLDDTANTFGNGVAVAGRNVTLVDDDSIDLRASTVSGNLNVTSLAGTITQSGALNVTGSSTFTAADGQSILLTNATNIFGGVRLASSGQLDDVSLAAASGLDLQGLNIAGDLAVATGGSLTQSGTLVVAGNADFRTLNSGSSIALNGANQFGSVNANGAGGVSITQGTGDLNLRQVTATGAARLEATGGSIVDDIADPAAASVSAASVELVALNNIGTVTDLLTRQGTAIAVNTNGGALAAHVGNASGHINLALPGGSAPTAAAGAISAGGSGRLLIQSAGDLSLNAFNAAITGFSEVGFSADGTLSMPGAQSDLIAGPLATLYLRGATDVARADRTFNLGAAHLIFDSGSQGGDVTLNTTAERLDASVGGGASLTVQNTGDLTLGTIGAGNNVTIGAANIRDDGDAGGVTRVTAGDAITLNASAGIGEAEGTGGGRIDTASNSVALNANAGSVYLSHAGDLQVSGNAAAGSIDVAAPTGSITVTSTLRANGPLTLVAGTDGAVTGNITLTGSVQSTGAATLTAANGGTIADASDAATHLTAQTANLTAATVGSQANALNVEVGTLNAAVGNDLYVNATNAIRLGVITATSASISASGAIADDGDNATRIAAQSLTLAGTTVGAAGAGNEIDTAVDRLSAAASAGGIYVGESGDVQLATLSATGSGNDIVVTAAGTISDDGDDATRISGGTLTLNATSIGAAGAGLGTQVTALNASASSGGVFVNEADDLQLNTISGTDVTLTAGGALTDDGNDATRISGTNVSLTAARIGTADNRIDTAAGSLSTVATAGGVFVAEQDDVALTEVRASGTGNTVDLRTGGNGSMTVQTLVTQGGAVTLTSGGTGSITVTGAIESNNGVVNLISGNALALPGLDTGTGAVILRTVNDLNVGTITASSVSITSDTGNVSLGTIDATGGTVTVTANNGAITDGDTTSLTARDATLSARAIGGPDQALNLAIDSLTATASAGGIHINDIGGLALNAINATGVVSIVTTGALTQNAAIVSGGHDIELFAESIAMRTGATTRSGNGDISYVANGGAISLESLDAGTGRALVIAADSVYSTLDPNAGINNLSGSMVEIRAGGLGGGKGEIGTLDHPINIATPGSSGRSVYLIVPAVNGIQMTTPFINYTGSWLLKGYTGSTGALLFDLSSTFSPETILSGDETLVPLLNGRVAVNSDSLSAAKQALSSGVIARINVDWAAFDPNVSLFGTLDPSLRLPADQVDEEVPVPQD